MTNTAERIAELRRMARIEAHNQRIACTALGRKGAAYRRQQLEDQIAKLEAHEAA